MILILLIFPDFHETESSEFSKTKKLFNAWMKLIIRNSIIPT